MQYVWEKKTMNQKAHFITEWQNTFNDAGYKYSYIKITEKGINNCICDIYDKTGRKTYSNFHIGYYAIIFTPISNAEEEFPQ